MDRGTWWATIHRVTKSDTAEATYHACSGDTELENRLLDTVQGEEGEAGMYGERNKETYFTICKIDSQWEFAMTQGTQTRDL